MLTIIILAAFAVVCCNGQSNLCAAPNGDFPNPSSEQCTTYFRCIQGTPILLRCPANQRFEFLFRVCRPQAEVDCARQLEVFAAPTVVQGIGGLGGLPNLGGLAGAGIGGLAGGLGGGLGAGLGGGLAGGLGGGLGGAGALGGGGGLINLLAQLDGGDGGDGNNGNNGLATVLALTALMNQRNGGLPPQGPFTGQLQTAPLLTPQTNQWQQQVPQQQTFGNSGNLGAPGQGTSFTTDDGRTFVVYPQFANLQLPPGGAQTTLQEKGSNNNILTQGLGQGQDQAQRRGQGNGQWRRKIVGQRRAHGGGQFEDEAQAPIAQFPSVLSTDNNGSLNKTNITSVIEPQ